MSLGRPKKTHNQYLAEVLERYGPHVKVLDTYTVSTVKIRHKCTKHNYVWSKNPTWNRAVKGPSGCIHCRRDLGIACRVPDTHFAAAVLRVSPHLRVIGKYTRSDEQILMKCTIHKLEFLGWPSNLKAGTGCPKCATEKCQANTTYVDRRRTHADFLKEIKDIFGTSLRVTSEYLGYGSPITVRIQKCGHEVTMNASWLRQFERCPICSPLRKRRYSVMAIKWIEQEARSRRMKNVRHAECGGEYKIPGTPWHADGYHERTNTIFEFYGDAFHGNPNKFNDDDTPNPWLNKTAKQLYAATRKRENALVRLGYRVIVMWEADYKVNTRLHTT